MSNYAQNVQLEVKVTDADGNVGTDTVIVGVIDRLPDSGVPDDEGTQFPPVVNPGPDQEVTVGDTVTLDGSLTQILVGSIETYAWTKVSGPSVTIDDADESIATFDAPDSPAEFVFRLTATADNGLEASATVRVDVFTDDAPPPAPTEFIAEPLGADNIYLSWEPGYAAVFVDPDDRYTLEYISAADLDAGNAWTVAVAKSRYLNHNLFGLTEFTEYSFRLRTRGNGGNSPYVYLTESTTGTPGVPTEKPEIVHLVPDNRSLYLFWGSIDDTSVTGIKMRHAASAGALSGEGSSIDAGEIPAFNQDLPVNGGFANGWSRIPSLTNGQARYVQIRLVNDEGDGPWSDAVSATPDDDLREEYVMGPAEGLPLHNYVGTSGLVVSPYGNGNTNLTGAMPSEWFGLDGYAVLPWAWLSSGNIQVHWTSDPMKLVEAFFLQMEVTYARVGFSGEVTRYLNFQKLRRTTTGFTQRWPPIKWRTFSGVAFETDFDSGYVRVGDLIKIKITTLRSAI